jgi:hypothetical protein
MRLKTVKFKKVISWIKKNRRPITVFTMGGNSCLIVSYCVDRKAICISGSNGKTIVVEESFWQHAMEYIESLSDDDSLKTKMYERPNVVCNELSGISNFGPSFPAICKAYWTYHKR